MANSGARPMRLLILVFFATAQRCDGFSAQPTSRAKPSCGVYNPCARQKMQLWSLRDDDGDVEEKGDGVEDEDEDDRDSYTWEELQADPELSKLEFDSSINRKNSMLLPQRVSQAVSALAWSFVIGGIILNSVGYAWVKDPAGGIGVGTLDKRDFQREIQREIRRERMEGEGENQPAAMSVSHSGISSRHIFSLLQQGKDSVSV